MAKIKMTAEDAATHTTTVKKLRSEFDTLQARAAAALKTSLTHGQEESCIDVVNFKADLFKTIERTAYRKIEARSNAVTNAIDRMEHIIRKIQTQFTNRQIPAIALFLLSAGIAYYASNKSEWS